MYGEDQQQHEFNTMPSRSEYEQVGKEQAERFSAELTDLYTRYQYSTVGDMERSGMLTAGEDILSALSKIELFKQSL